MKYAMNILHIKHYAMMNRVVSRRCVLHSENIQNFIRENIFLRVRIGNYDIMMS